MLLFDDAGVIAIPTVVVPVTVTLTVPLWEGRVPESPKYWALIWCVPTVSELVLMLAAPFVTATPEPSVAVPLKSCTIPPGVAPEEVTAMLKLSDVPIATLVCWGAAIFVIVAMRPTGAPASPPPQPTAKLTMQTNKSVSVAR